MKISLKGQTALVGGASKGLGKAIAFQLAACGASVTLMARDEERMKSLVAELPAMEGQHHGYLVVDFGNFDAFKQIVSAWFKSNTVDILVNNTNGPQAGGALEKQTDDYQVAFDLLFKTVHVVTTAALEGMRAARFGRIINLSSSTVKEPLPNLVLSNSVRAAVINWSKTLARTVASEGITVNNILTGYFDTERLSQINLSQAEKKGMLPEEVKNALLQEIPAARFGEPAEFGHLVAFLASRYANYITGTSIPIDGGLARSI